jgi:hypothetical protein
MALYSYTTGRSSAGSIYPFAFVCRGRSRIWPSKLDCRRDGLVMKTLISLIGLGAALSLVPTPLCLAESVANGGYANAQPGTTNQTSADCPSGTLLELHSGGCFPARDVTANGMGQQPTPVRPPSLLELRRQQRGVQSARPSAQPLRTQSGMPTPGGIGVGIIYRSGQLQAINGSELTTNMIVHPEGLNPSNLGLDWLFTTASNRTEKGVEVVGIYPSNSPGSLGVFDWSCSPNDPCVQGNTAPAWVWVTVFTNLACNVKSQLTNAGYIQNVMKYNNLTTETAFASPPSWQNAVYLFNYCNNGWDLVYQHQYKVDQQDCSIGCSSLGFSLGWWGPIFETFPSATGDPFPQINNLGFEGTALLHDGVWSYLSSDESDASAQADFSYPNSPWLLFFLDAKRSFEAGNYAGPELTTKNCQNSGWQKFGFAGLQQCLNYVNSH